MSEFESLYAKNKKLKALIEFKLTGTLPENPALAQTVQARKDEFMVFMAFCTGTTKETKAKGFDPCPL